MNIHNYHRTSDLLDFKKISQLKIAYAGAGSLISFTASGLLYPFGAQLFADPGVMKEENLERHWVDTWDELGQPKVEALKRRIVAATRGKVDPTTILVHRGPIEDAFDWMTDADLIIVGIDDEISKGRVNDFALQYNIPALYGGLSAKGVSGTVVAIPTPRDVCYLCAQHALGKDVTQGPTDGNYGFDITDPRANANLVAEPALKVSVQIIGTNVAILAQRMLNIRKGGEPVQPSILYDAIDWDPVLTISRGNPILVALANFIAAFPQLGLISTQKIQFDGKDYQYLLNFQRMAVKLTRWSRCPNHDISAISLDQI